MINITGVIRHGGLLGTFSLSSLAAIIVISIFSGSVFFSFIEKNLLKRELEISSEFIQSSSLFRDSGTYFSGNADQKMKQDINDFFQHIAYIPDVFKVIIYNRHYKALWSSNPELIGKVFPPTDELDEAYQGRSVFTIINEKERLKQEYGFLPASTKAFVEGYLPVWNKEHTNVIGVIELYKTPRAMFDVINKGHLLVLIVFLFSGLTLFGFLYWIVSRADNLIGMQKARIKQASSRAVELNEHNLRRIGSELHDGPAQSIGYALLKLDSVLNTDSESTNTYKNITLIEQIQTALSDSLKEIRGLSAGLVIPDLKEMCADQAIQKVITRHEKRTSTHVERQMKKLPQDVNISTKICIYRFIQEGLNNAFRHGKGINQYVGLEIDEKTIVVIVSDTGPGMGNTKITQSTDAEHLGLRGLRDRIECLGGTFRVQNNRKYTGVTITTILPL